MRSPRSLVFVFLTVSFVALQSLLFAGTESNSVNGPKALIESLQAEMAKIMSEAKPGNAAAAQATVKKKFRKHFDLGTFARLSFRKYYKKLSDNDRKRYHETLQELVEATYLKRLKPGADYWVKSRGEQLIDTRAKISITVGSKDSEFDVDYLLQKSEEGQWRIYDIWIDDVSMVKTYRSQFYKVYKKHGFSGSDGLLGHMKRRQLDQDTGCKCRTTCANGPASCSGKEDANSAKCWLKCDCKANFPTQFKALKAKGCVSNR